MNKQERDNLLKVKRMELRKRFHIMINGSPLINKEAVNDIINEIMEKPKL